MPVQRDENGKVTGGNLRGESTKKRAQGLSRYLRNEMKRRYNDPRAYWLWLMDIAANTAEKAADRIKAIDLLAVRIEGKPVDAIALEVSGPAGGPVQSEMTSHAQAPTERLAALLRSAAVLAQAGVGAPTGGVGSPVGGAPAESSRGIGSAGEGEPPA